MAAEELKRPWLKVWEAWNFGRFATGRPIFPASAWFCGLGPTETEAAELAEGDIGVAWMPDDSWSLGKCGLKVLQYMAAGLPVVANPVGIHREMIVHGETGFIASTPQQWAEAVARLAADPHIARTSWGQQADTWPKNDMACPLGGRSSSTLFGGENALRLNVRACFARGYVIAAKWRQKQTIQSQDVYHDGI